MIIVRRHLRLLALTAAALLAIAGGAFAFFSSSGAGSGAGGVQVTLNAVSVTPAATTQALLPTGTASGDLGAALHNDNASTVHISAITLDTAQGSDGFSANAAGCALSVASEDNGGAGWTLAGNSSLSVDLAGAVTMGTTAASSCQGRTFTVYLRVS